MDKETEARSAWVRWSVLAALVVIANIGSVFYIAGDTRSQIVNNERRLVALEQTAVTKEQFSELKQDLKDVKADIKELLKQRR